VQSIVAEPLSQSFPERTHEGIPLLADNLRARFVDAFLVLLGAWPRHVVPRGLARAGRVELGGTRGLELGDDLYALGVDGGLVHGVCPWAWGAASTVENVCVGTEGLLERGLPLRVRRGVGSWARVDAVATHVIDENVLVAVSADAEVETLATLAVEFESGGEFLLAGGCLGHVGALREVELVALAEGGRAFGSVERVREGGVLVRIEFELGVEWFGRGLEAVASAHSKRI